MPIKSSDGLSFTSYYVEKRKTKRVFLQQISALIHWEAVNNVLAKHSPTGQSGQGIKAYPALVLFKMTLLQTWNNLSDMSGEDTVPDHSKLSRFRSELVEKKAMHRLLAELNAQLAHQGVLVQQGSILDASITPTFRKPHGKTTYLLPGHPDTPPTKEVKPGVDQEAAWVKKCSKLQYGYKRHYLAEEDTGMVLAVHTTSANAHDSQYLEACLRKVKLLPQRSRVLADKGYCAKANEALLHSKGLRSGIQRKAYRNRPLTNTEKRYNNLVGKVRYKIERVFGSIKRWFGRLEARYVGLAKTHGQHVLEAIAYNLYRLPGIILPMV